MKFDAMLLDYKLDQVADYTKAVEAAGFDGLVLGEAKTDPFPGLTLVAEHSKKMNLGPGIAVAFARSPGTLAYLGWNLAEYSQGRFIMGLGTQVRAHNERRFGVKWEKPVKKMRETILAMRAFWDCWQNGTPFRYRGEFFNLKLMAPFFNPGPHDYPDVPVYIAAVNKMMLQLSGEICDGTYLHALHTVPYIKEFALPHIHAGAEKAGRNPDDIKVCTGIFVIPTDEAELAAKTEDFIREQLSFYMSTPAYRVVMEIHGWEEIGFKLSKAVRRAKYEEMKKLITDEMLDEVTVSGTWAELPGKIHAKYGNLLDRVSYYLPYTPGENEDGWRATIEGIKKTQKPGGE